MESLQRNTIYSNNEGKIIRLVAFDPAETAFVVDCKSKKSGHVHRNTLYSYQEMTQEEMVSLTLGSVPEYNSLTKVQKKVVRDRYALISPLLLCDIENDLIRSSKIKEIAEQNNMLPSTVEKYLNTYLAYGRIETLLPKKDNFLYDLKPKLIIKPDIRQAEVGHAILCKERLQVSVNGKCAYFYALIDSYTGFIYGHDLSLKFDSFVPVKGLFYKCLNKVKSIPFKVTSVVTQETYNTNARNLSNLGVSFAFKCGHRINNLVIGEIVHQINISCKNLQSFDELKKQVKAIVDRYNERGVNGLSPKASFVDARPIFKDSFIPCTKKELEDIFNSDNYRSYFAE